MTSMWVSVSFGPVEGVPLSHGTQRGCCVCMEVSITFHIVCGRKVPTVYKYEFLSNY